MLSDKLVMIEAEIAIVDEKLSELEQTKDNMGGNAG